MNCNEAQQHWHESHDTGVKDIALEDHLRHCDACRNMALQLTALTEALNEMRRATESVGSALESNPSAPHGLTAQHQPVMTRFWQMAAMIALATCAWLFYSTLRNSDGLQVVVKDSTKTQQADDPFETRPIHAPPLGITLRGKSKEAYLAVAQPMTQPGVQFYRLYPMIAVKSDTSDF